MTDELIARLEGGKGGDRELDALIAAACCNVPTDMPIPQLAEGWSYIYRADGDSVLITPRHKDGRTAMPHRRWAGQLTSSIDAALALVEKMRPGDDWLIVRDGGSFHCEISEGSSLDLIGEAKGVSAPRAVLAALLRALAKEEANADG